MLGLDEPLHGVAREADDLAGAAGDALADRLQRGLALALDLDVDAAPVEPVLEVGERCVGVVDVARHVALEALRLVGDRVGEQEAEPDQERDQADHHDRDRRAARDVQRAAAATPAGSAAARSARR